MKNYKRPGEKLTNEKFWDTCYSSRDDFEDFNEKDWKKHTTTRLVQKLKKLNLNKSKILEIGGGDAEILSYLAAQYTSSDFSIIDYSAKGCERARQRMKNRGLQVEVICADLFSPPEYMLNQFDFVLSFGLVEHFSDLAGILTAKQRFLKQGGKIFTLIPNYSFLYKTLTKRWSERVLGMHVLHTMETFREGHSLSKLKIIDSGYIGSLEFGVLSMAIKDMPKYRKLERVFYLWLTRLSKLIHYFEYHLVNLPANKYFSPYIYIVSSQAKMK